MNKRDKRVFQKILKYCGQVIWTHDFFHVDKTLFFNEQDGIAYRNAIAMPILIFRGVKLSECVTLPLTILRYGPYQPDLDVKPLRGRRPEWRLRVGGRA